MTIKAKPILKDRFWILEDEGVRIGTLSLSENQYMLNSNDGTSLFDDEHQLKKRLGKDFTWTDLEIKETQSIKTKFAYGFPTSCVPYNSMYDVKRKLPLFTKSKKSKSLYCAGYYIIRFDKGWVKSFCPKLITVERYDTRGPFKTEIEMRQELSNVN